MIKGHNPLLLLHDALSQGLHAETDEECLGIAGSIRALLSRTAEQIEFAKKDDDALSGALSTLFKKKSDRKKQSKPKPSGDTAEG